MRHFSLLILVSMIMTGRNLLPLQSISIGAQMKERKKLSFRWTCHLIMTEKPTGLSSVQWKSCLKWQITFMQYLHKGFTYAAWQMEQTQGSVMTPECRSLPALVCFIMMHYVVSAQRNHFPPPPSLSFKCAEAWRKKKKKTCIFTSGVVNRLYISCICCDVCLRAPNRLLPQIKSPTHTFCNNVLQLSRSIMHSLSDAGTKRSVISLTENDSLISEMYSVLVAK